MIFCSDCPYKDEQAFLGCYLDASDFCAEHKAYWEAMTGEEYPLDTIENMEYNGTIRTEKCLISGSEVETTAIFTGSEW